MITQLLKLPSTYGAPPGDWSNMCKLSVGTYLQGVRFELLRVLLHLSPARGCRQRALELANWVEQLFAFPTFISLSVNAICNDASVSRALEEEQIP